MVWCGPAIWSAAVGWGFGLFDSLDGRVPVGFTLSWRWQSTLLDGTKGFAMLNADNRPSSFHHNTEILLASGRDIEGAS